MDPTVELADSYKRALIEGDVKKAATLSAQIASVIIKSVRAEGATVERAREIADKRLAELSAEVDEEVARGLAREAPAAPRVGSKAAVGRATDLTIGKMAILADIRGTSLTTLEEDGREVLQQYAPGCAVLDNGDGTVSISWDDGAANASTIGATTDYVPKWAYWKVVFESRAYAPNSDFNALIIGKVPPLLALIIVQMRQIVSTSSMFRLNSSEMTLVENDKVAIKLTADQLRVLKENAEGVNAIVQQAFTICAMNGISMITKGHHYNETDSMWKNLVRAIKMDEIMAKLKINEWEGYLFHDAMHPLAFEEVATAVAYPDHVILKHVHGTAKIRMPCLPAGTIILNILIALINDVRAFDAKIAAAFDELSSEVKQVIADVHRRPLNYTQAFPSTKTLERIQRVKTVLPVAAFLAGFLTQALETPSTTLRAPALKAAMKQNANYVALGGRAYTELPRERLTYENLTIQISLAIRTAIAELTTARTT